MTTSAEWTPSDKAWRQAASTAGRPQLIPYRGRFDGFRASLEDHV